MRRIHLISGPRNLSTALMYSFKNRGDTIVVDEAFYAYYLLQNPVNHPGKQEIISSMSGDLASILEEVVFAYYSKPILFIKNMAHHFVDLDYSILNELENIFLIRDLSKLIRSFSKVIPNPTLMDIGIKIEYELYKYLESHGKEAIVIDSDELLKNPRSVLTKLCTRLNISFTEKMLSWEPGPRPEDGIWAKYWYHSVHKSTCFKAVSSENPVLKDHLMALYEESYPYYAYLKERSIKA